MEFLDFLVIRIVERNELTIDTLSFINKKNSIIRFIRSKLYRIDIDDYFVINCVNSHRDRILSIWHRANRTKKG